VRCFARRHNPLLGLALALLPLFALAQEWEPVTETDAAAYLIDKSSLVAEGGKKTARILVTGPDGQSLATYGSRIQRVVFDCAGGVMALKEYTLYALPGGQGAVLRTESYEDARLDFTRPAAGSVGERLLATACEP